MLIHNNNYSTKFFDIESMNFVNPIEEGVRLSNLCEKSLDAHVKNCWRVSQRPDTYHSVLGKIIPIPPRTSWQVSEAGVYQLGKRTFSTEKEKSMTDVIRLASRLAMLIDNKMAVELSGGLDTAILIGILKSIGTSPVLVGAISERYEFRTERYIQEKIASESKFSHFVNEVDALPFANLKKTPIHAIPNKASLFYYLNEITASWAAKNSLQYVINGIGFDAVLIDQVGSPQSSYFFDPKNLDDGWANDYVYKRHGVYYINVASIYSVLKILITMRAGQSEDSQKFWARNAFREYIPEELSKFRYKASFGAVYDEGLERARNEILEICEDVYNLTKMPQLNPKVMGVLLNGVRSYDHVSEFDFLARMSYANWVYQLHRYERIIYD